MSGSGAQSSRARSTVCRAGPAVTAGMSRQRWQPRLSVRASAAVATSVHTVCRLVASSTARSRPRSAGGAWSSRCSSCSSPARSRNTPACRDIAAARRWPGGRADPRPGAGNRSAGGGPGSRPARHAPAWAVPVPSRSPTRRPVISDSVSELEASRLAPCTPVEAASPTAYRPGDAGPPVQVGPDAAAGVVRARRDRDGLGDRVDAARPAGRGHRGEVPLQRRRPSRWRRARGDRRARPAGSSAAAWPPRPRPGAPGRRAGDGRPSPAGPPRPPVPPRRRAGPR